MTLSAPTTDEPVDSPRAYLLTTILLGGSAVALFDAANPVLFWWIARGVSPAVIFKSVASGLLGKETANSGGAGVVCLGIFLHVFIAYTVAAVYGVASWRLRVLTRHPIICGIAYGAAVFGVMNYVVLPHSGAKPQAFLLFEVIGDLFGKGPSAVTVKQLWFLFDFFGHLLGIGPLVVWAVHWSARRAH